MTGRVLLAAALEGHGIVLQPDAILRDALDAGRLVPILPDYTAPLRPMVILFSARRPQPPGSAKLHRLRRRCFRASELARPGSNDAVAGRLRWVENATDPTNLDRQARHCVSMTVRENSHRGGERQGCGHERSGSAGAAGRDDGGCRRTRRRLHHDGFACSAGRRRRVRCDAPPDPAGRRRARLYPGSVGRPHCRRSGPASSPRSSRPSTIPTSPTRHGASPTRSRAAGSRCCSAIPIM